MICGWKIFENDLDLEKHIDISNFWFHSNEDVKYGGMNEWVRDNNLTWADDNVHPSGESHRKFAYYLNKLDECRYLFK